jgi:hypothetical protein
MSESVAEAAATLSEVRQEPTGFSWYILVRCRRKPPVGASGRLEP